MKTAISFILLTDWCSLTIIYLILPTIHDKKQFITRKMYIHKYVYRYNKMLSLVISVEYEGSDIAENIFSTMSLPPYPARITKDSIVLFNNNNNRGWPMILSIQNVDRNCTSMNI